MTDNSNITKQELKEETSTIECPSCGEGIDVQEVLGKRTEMRLRAEYNQKFISLKKDLESQREELQREKLEVKQLSSQTWEIIQEKLKKERIRLAEEMRKEAEKQSAADREILEKELEKQQQENMEMRRRELLILQREKQLQQDQEKLKLDLERKFMLQQNESEKSIRSQMQTQQEMLRREYEKKIEDQRKLIDEMTRKMEQGSMQMQGEVQEMAIEDFLQQTFWTDEVEAIKTGSRGADCILNVKTDRGDACGSIYFESKRTKTFQPIWIEKFKADMRVHKADIGILVTQVLPNEIEHMGEKDGVWICSFEHMKILIPILRDGLLRIHEVKAHQEQRGEKVHVLYNFLTSNEFRMQVEGIVEGFTQLQSELQREKRAMESIWKRREKQIEKVLLNTNHMYSSIRGIAGSEIGQIDALELPEGDL